MLINGESVLKALEGFRVVTIMGRYGSHKTALAFWLAYELYRAKLIERVVSNCRSIWNEDLGEFHPPDPYKIKTAIILDEGGLYLKTSRSSEEYTAFLRKMDVYLLIPSVKLPARDLQTVSIQMVYTLMGLGVPLIIYRSMINTGAYRDVTYFAWWRPSSTYGIYNTRSSPVDGSAISHWLAKQKDRIKESSGVDLLYEMSANSILEELTQRQEEAAEAQLAALEQMEDIGLENKPRSWSPFK